MKKKLFLIALLLFAINANAQIGYNKKQYSDEQENLKESAFSENRIYGSIGYGAPWLRNFSSTAIGPIYGKIEYGVSNSIGVGINAAYANDPVSTNKPLSFSVLGRLNIHALPNNEKIDFYIGLGVGYRYMRDLGVFKDFTNYNLGMDATLGLRVMISENIGGYTEIGIAKSPFQIGLSVRL